MYCWRLGLYAQGITRSCRNMAKLKEAKSWACSPSITKRKYYQCDYIFKNLKGQPIFNSCHLLGWKWSAINSTILKFKRNILCSKKKWDKIKCKYWTASKINEKPSECCQGWNSEAWHIKSVVLHGDRRGDCARQGPRDNVWRRFWLLSLWTGVLLASRGQRPEMLLSAPQCPGQPHSREHPAPNGTSAKTEKPCFKSLDIFKSQKKKKKTLGNACFN